MLTYSRTWPSILTMAVVQLRLDPKGRTYSTIANTFSSDTQNSNCSNNNGTLKQHNQLAITSNNNNSKNHHYNQHNSCNKKDLISIKNTASQTTANGCAFRSTHSATQHTNGGNNINNKQHQVNNGNGTNGIEKICYCEFDYRDHCISHNCGDSINEDNWEYVYEEKKLHPAPIHNEDLMQRSPTAIYNKCNDHGYLSGLAALKADTLFRHYYPEGAWGWVIVVVAIFVAILNHGVQLASPLYLLPAAKRFSVNEVIAVGK